MTTRPPAQEQETQQLQAKMVAAAGNDFTWRLEQSAAMAEIRVTTRYTQQRLEEHIEEDRRRFEKLEGTDGRAAERIGKYERDKQQIVGVDKFLTKLFAVIGGAGTFILFMIAVYKFMVPLR